MDVSDIFIFSCSGEGKGESKAPGGGEGDFLWKKATLRPKTYKINTEYIVYVTEKRFSKTIVPKQFSM